MAVKIDEDACTGCGICVDVCPVDALELNDVVVVDEGDCIECGACVPECPVDALSL